MIVPMKRLTLMALKRDEADIMGRLQDAEVVQVVSSESASAPNSELESVNRDVSTLAEALQAVNTKIFKAWLPGNHEYEIAMEANIEWYAKGDTQSPDYESAIWIPVKRK